MRFTGVDASVLPPDQSARQVDDALRAGFDRDAASPILVAVTAPAADGAAVQAYRDELAAVAGEAATVSAPQPLGETWRIDVEPATPSLDGATKELVRDVRALDAPFPVAVGGSTAAFLDGQDSLRDRVPLALAVLVGTTVVLLFLMTGSIVLPIKAVLMNALTICATFGLLVLVFQDGRLTGLLDYEPQGALESTQPILLFAIVFALSTDYGTFLLGRIGEARAAGVPDREAIAVGLARTGRVVTAAALLMMTAIGAFATSEIVFIKLIGVGAALAVLIDATIVRALLVPALMGLLGRANWYAPRWLQAVHRRVGPARGGRWPAARSAAPRAVARHGRLTARRPAGGPGGPPAGGRAVVRLVGAGRLERARRPPSPPDRAVVRRLDRDVREQPVEPARDVPGLLAEQREEARARASCARSARP